MSEADRVPPTADLRSAAVPRRPPEGRATKGLDPLLPEGKLRQLSLYDNFINSFMTIYKNPSQKKSQRNMLNYLQPYFLYDNFIRFSKNLYKSPSQKKSQRNILNHIFFMTIL